MSTAAGTENGNDTEANGQGPADGDNAEDNAATDTDQNSDASNEDQGDDDEEAFDAARAKEALRKKNNENRALRKRTADAEAKAKDADGKDNRITALEAENLRFRVGARHGLPEALIERLKGNTEEEILQDAEKLLELVSPTKRPPTNVSKERLRGGGDPTQEQEETDVAKLGASMFRN
ncbi:hypothetical protein [Paenarthrobacter ilicis]|uniref:hypothetical protein n=1 Tax=Paenarthrobacter ilicis TaxID=43665 RepID=UPI0028D71CBA|nr:hypothetical protein [Paenarthrobacter ilicis]